MKGFLVLSVGIKLDHCPKWVKLNSTTFMAHVITLHLLCQEQPDQMFKANNKEGEATSNVCLKLISEMPK